MWKELPIADKGVEQRRAAVVVALLVFCPLCILFGALVWPMAELKIRQ